MDEQTSRKQVHVLTLPFPVQGHINALLSIARLLAPHGFTFTFVLPHHFSVPPIPAEQKSTVEPIRFVTVRADSTDGPLVDDDDGHGAGGRGDVKFDLMKVMNKVERMQAGCMELLRELTSLSSTSQEVEQDRSISFILADSFVTWSYEVASHFGIPHYLFFTINAHTCALFLHTPSLLLKGSLPIHGDPEQIFDGLDGVPPLCARDLPMSVRKFPDFVSKLVERIGDAAGVIFNTVEDFERKPLDAIRRSCAVYTIGPMLLMEKDSPLSSLSMWAEDKQCLTWLDSMPALSVHYVSFGSLSTMSMEQIRELAEGLDASGVFFLWVIRPNAVAAADSPLLSDSFYERTCGRGLVITWAPQLAVLSHPSIGGFLTHCGWNSITENLSLGGVPMICWPQLAEQRLNARLLVDEWRIGLELLCKDEEGAGVVKGAAIEKVAKDLMQGEVGKELRKRTAQLKDIAFQAVQEGGSSLKHLKALVKDMKKRAY